MVPTQEQSQAETSSPRLVKQHGKALRKAQVAHTRPVGRIRPSTLFHPARHLVSTQRQCRALASVLRSSYIYTVLKLHSALWRRPQGWCGPQWNWVWHPCAKGSGKGLNTKIKGKRLHIGRRFTCEALRAGLQWNLEPDSVSTGGVWSAPTTRLRPSNSSPSGHCCDFLKAPMFHSYFQYLTSEDTTSKRKLKAPWGLEMSWEIDTDPSCNHGNLVMV